MLSYNKICLFITILLFISVVFLYKKKIEEFRHYNKCRANGYTKEFCLNKEYPGHVNPKYKDALYKSFQDPDKAFWWGKLSR